jgi:hypothetical protein
MGKDSWQKTEVRRQETDDKYFPVGAAFPDLSLSKVSRDLVLSTASTIYLLPFTPDSWLLTTKY